VKTELLRGEPRASRELRRGPAKASTAGEATDRTGRRAKKRVTGAAGGVCPRVPSRLPPRRTPHATAHRACPLRPFWSTSPACVAPPFTARTRGSRGRPSFLALPSPSPSPCCSCWWCHVAAAVGRDGARRGKIPRQWRRVQVPSPFLLFSCTNFGNLFDVSSTC
jgi:hypothetical protein